MNEPKRRGRPPKALPPETVKFLAHADALAVAQSELDAAVAAGTPLTPSQERLKRDNERDDRQAAQHYARRVWNGQSPDVPRNERLRRVAKALEGQGLSMEGVEL